MRSQDQGKTSSLLTDSLYLQAQHLNNEGWELQHSNIGLAKMASRKSLQISVANGYKQEWIKSLINLSSIALLEGKYDSVFMLVDSAMNLANKNGYVYQQARILKIKARANYHRLNYQDALNELIKANNYFEQIGDSIEWSDGLYHLSMIYRDLHQQDKSIITIQKVIDIHNARNDHQALAKSSLIMAQLSQTIGDYPNALAYYTSCVNHSHKINHQKQKATALQGLGEIMALLGNYRESVKYFTDAIFINEKNGYSAALAKNYLSLGENYLALNEYVKALDYFNLGTGIMNNIEDYKNVCKGLNHISDLYIRTGELEMAENYALKALNIADSLQDIVGLQFSYLNLYKVRKKQDSFEESLEYFSQYQLLSDSIIQLDKKDRIEELRARYELDKIEKENTILKTERELNNQIIRNQRLILYGFISVFLFVAVLIIILFLSRKKFMSLSNKLQERNREIYEQAIELSKTNATKDKLFSIIGHDLKNPFLGLIGFADLLKNEINNADLEQIKKYAGLIQASSKDTYNLLENLLEWSLSQRGNIQISRKNIRLNDVIIKSYQINEAVALEKKIKLINHVNGKLTIHSDENMIWTIIRNLVGNAIKFTRTGGSVEVNATLENDQVIISVKDSGVGIPPEKLADLFVLSANDSTEGTMQEKGKGLGLILCKEFAMKLEGDIWAESQEGKGSTFFLRLPAADPEK